MVHTIKELRWHKISITENAGKTDNLFWSEINRYNREMWIKVQRTEWSPEDSLWQRASSEIIKDGGIRKHYWYNSQKILRCAGRGRHCKTYKIIGVAPKNGKLRMQM